MPITVSSSGEMIELGTDVPARVIVMEAVRRDGHCEKFDIEIEAQAIDWEGLDDAIVRLEITDVEIPTGLLAWVPGASA